MSLQHLLHKLQHNDAKPLFSHDKNTPVRDAVTSNTEERLGFTPSRLSTNTQFTTSPDISTRYQTNPKTVVPRIQVVLDRVFGALYALLCVAIVSLLIAWLGINWITGCGQTMRTIDGIYIEGDCVLVPWVKS